MDEAARTIFCPDAATGCATLKNNGVLRVWLDFATKPRKLIIHELVLNGDTGNVPLGKFARDAGASATVYDVAEELASLMMKASYPGFKAEQARGTFVVDTVTGEGVLMAFNDAGQFTNVPIK